ncbi:serine hydrolase [Mesorhizobium sp. M0408]|uniref:serine hydrolase domain-containing protein n=1 Tax=Mesorhizobium sp. M0408 TaxID=2956942 RepID=UPI00333DFE6B
MTTSTTMHGTDDVTRLPPGGAAFVCWTPEQQIIGFRSREKIDPVRVVGRSANVRHLPLAIHHISPRWNWDAQEMDVDRYMEAQRVSGIVVLRGGRVIFERYGLGRRESDCWMSLSAAKSVTSILVGAAVQDGYIESLDAPVSDYIPELRESAYEGVSIRQLLTMTTGVKWNEDYTDPNSDARRSVWSTPELGVNPVVAYMRRLPRADSPGSKFAYKSGDTDLAGILVSTAVGKSLSEYLSDKLWRPYGMEADAFWAVDGAGHEFGGGGISATLRDYARIGQFMLEGGKAGAIQVLPATWVEDSTSAHVVFSEENGATYLNRREGYGYFWWIYKDGYAALGWGGQAIFVFPKEHLVIAINSAWPEPNLPEYRQAQEAFVEAVRAAALTQPSSPVRE